MSLHIIRLTLKKKEELKKKKEEFMQGQGTSYEINHFYSEQVSGL